MPSSTFLNLPVDKRERILAAAISEFADKSYYQASITSIIDKAEIARGSFYQYFRDKEDLIMYIIELAAEKKKEFIQPLLDQSQEIEFFALVRQLYLSGFKFAKQNPQLATIGRKMTLEADYKEIMSKFMRKLRPISDNLFEHLIIQAINKRQVNAKVDPEIAAFVITTLNITIMEQLHSQLDVLANTTEALAVIDKMLYIIENGMGAKN